MVWQINYSVRLLYKLFKICFILLPGEWSNGHLEGKGRLVTKNTTVWECWCHLSCLHGPVRKIEMKKFRMFKQQGIIMLFIFIFLVKIKYPNTKKSEAKEN